MPEDSTCSGYVAIDDLAYRKGHRYMCAIADHYTRKVLAVFDTRYGPEIGEWFKKHPEIKLVSRDGSWAYASIIKGALPNAKQVSDHFHLDKRLGDNMVEVIQKMICQTDGTLPYPYPLEGEAKSYIMEDIYDIGDAKHRKMVCNYYAARHTTSEKLLRLKQTQPNIDKILQACISFRRMIAGKENAPDIDDWLKLAYDCHCTKLTSFAEYISGDKEAVRNTYLTNYSNGIMEGTVNKIKAIKRSMFNKASVVLLRAKAIYGRNTP